ncbi:MAG TPA: hypothetical protein VHE82_09495 [Gemmatimonadaceae bacterium]|nr:hypothetical protein [Gemmatimonadaceae bacterium]
MKALILSAFALLGLTSALRAQDTTYSAPDTGYVEYDESPISLPLGVGLRIPSYDRVNGLALPWGPRLDLGEDKLQLDGLVTYRSNLGKWDPSLEGFARPGDANEIRIFVGRGTFTNDSWIRSDLANSAAALGVGSDSRNYFRGDRASARFTRTLTTTAFTLTPFIGGNIERVWSTGSIAPLKSPWSFFGRKGVLKMRRPNPRVETGRINSILAGSGIALSRGGVEGKLDVAVEHSLSTSLAADCSGFPTDAACRLAGQSFTQVTLDSKVDFPTFGSQSFSFKGHAVLTGKSIAPPQRFAYLGGSGTLATVNLLALGGDRLLYVQGDYTVPIDRIQLPYLGAPFIGLRYSAGNAGEGTLPPLIQNLGVGVGVSFFRADYSIDPARNRSPFSRRSAFSFGISLPM